MMSVPVFGAGLALAVILSWIDGRPSMQRTALVLVANWCAVLLVVLVSGEHTPWKLFILIDAVSCALVTRNPRSEEQAWIGAVYLFAILTHVVWGLAGSPAREGDYLTMLAAGGGLQIALLIGGAIHGGGKRILGRDRAGPRDGPASGGSRGMGAPQ
jgi:hypothetical protein